MQLIGPYELNTVVHGDCCDILPQIPDGSVDLVLTDPPYGQNHVSHRRNGQPSRPIQNDGFDEAIHVFTEAAYHFSRILKPNGVAICFTGFGDVDKLGRAAEFGRILTLVGLKQGDQFAWNKQIPSTGDIHRGFRPVLELGLVAWHPKAPYTWNPGRDIPNLISIQGVSPNNRHHPTEKPVDLLKTLISYYCPDGGVVLDPFIGSGSTGVAAKELGYPWLGIELDDVHCETAVRRVSQRELPLVA